MNKPFFIYLFSSALLHFLLLWLSESSRVRFELPLRRGEPIVVGNEAKAVTSSSPSKSGEVSATASHGTKTARKGISDGAEFGIAKPSYPQNSRLRGEEGRVLIKLTLDSGRALVKAEIAETSGYSDLDRAALQQVERDLPRSESSKADFEHFIEFNFSLSAPK